MNYRLRPHPQMPRIYLYREPVDFRKSYRGCVFHANVTADSKRT